MEGSKAMNSFRTALKNQTNERSAREDLNLKSTGPLAALTFINGLQDNNVWLKTGEAF